MLSKSQISIRHYRAAVLLAGAGRFDGSELTEAASMLIALSKNNAQIQCFAPDMPQHHVINHLDGSETQGA